jgi:hypothetical protein
VGISAWGLHIESSCLIPSTGSSQVLTSEAFVI